MREVNKGRGEKYVGVLGRRTLVGKTFRSRVRQPGNVKKGERREKKDPTGRSEGAFGKKRM